MKAIWLLLTKGAGRFVLLGSICLLTAMTLFISSRQKVSVPQVQGVIQIYGLEKEIQILRESKGIPHVRAGSEQEAYLALGFLHGQDRPNQLLWWRAAAQGRLSAWGGDGFIEEDRLARWLNLEDLSKEAVARLPQEQLKILSSYARGINLGWEQLRELDSRIGPPNNLAPEPWEVRDTFAVMLLYAWTIGETLEESLVLSRIVETLGGRDAQVFFPSRTEALRARLIAGPTISGGAVTPATGIGSLRRALGLEGSRIGSNALALGKGSAFNGPFLLAALHFPPTYPPRPYVAHLNTPKFSVTGVTVPGVPSFFSGWNSKVAWVSTAPGIVLTDLFVETIHPEQDSLYHNGRDWERIETRDEVLIRNNGYNLTQRMRSTRHGPLINDLVNESIEPMALSWLGHQTISDFGSYFALPHASTEEDILAALRLHKQPVLRVTYITQEGAYGTKLSGSVPQRGENSQLLPVPGRDSTYNWNGSIPFKELPLDRSSSTLSFILAADSRFSENPQLEWLWQSGERRERLSERIENVLANRDLALDKILELQSDVNSPGSLRIISKIESLPVFSKTLSTQANECLQLLKSWDGSYTKESKAASLFSRFRAHWILLAFQSKIDRSLLDKYLNLRHVTPNYLIEKILGGRFELSWLTAQEVKRVTAESLHKAWMGLERDFGKQGERWMWGRLSRLYFRSLWPQTEVRGDIGPFSYWGSEDTLQLADYEGLTKSGFYEVTTISSLRLGVDLSDPNKVRIAIVPGQSEHFTNPNSSDGIELWLAGKTAILEPIFGEEDISSGESLRLVPVK